MGANSSSTAASSTASASGGSMKDQSPPTATTHQVSIGSILARAAELYPNDLATIDGERQRTWRQVRDRVARVASGLVANGLKSGDRVCLLGYNSDHYFEALFAVSWAGAIVVPMNFRLSPPELNHILKDSGAVFLIADAACTESILPKLDVKSVKSVFTLGIPNPQGIEDFAESSRDLLPLSPRGGHDCYGKQTQL